MLAAHAERALEKILDPSHYTRFPRVRVFDEHEEWINVPKRDAHSNLRKDKHGKPILEKVKRVFKRQDLEELADVNNLREHATGDLAPICIGHTDDDGPETEQPPIVGYGRAFDIEEGEEPVLDERGRLQYGQDGKPLRKRKCFLVADLHIRKGEEEVLNKYPRRSIELWRKDKIIDPIALLRRTPERDLGLTTYSRRHPERVRYAKEYHTMPEMTKPPEAEAPLPDDEDKEFKPEDEPTGEEHTEYAKHCASHPLALKMAKHYGKAKFGADEAGVAGNVVVPPKELDLEKEKFRKNGKAANGDSIPDRYARMLETQDQQIKELRRERDLERYQRQCQSLLDNEHIDLDPAEEAERLVALPDNPAREKWIKHMQTRYAKLPTSHGMIDTDPGYSTEGGNIGGLDAPPKDPHEQQAIFAYAERHGLTDYGEAKRAYRKSCKE